jgi:formylglycine-generating enzyme required for sulfatase activity
MNGLKLAAVVLVSLLFFQYTVQARAPVISSLSPNGVLVCTNLQPGTMAAVLEANDLGGPWATNRGLILVNENGTFELSGMLSETGAKFYRVLGMPRGNASPTNMVLIPAGSFTMGDNLGDSTNEGIYDEVPVHTVYVSAFYMDKYDVTKALWDQVAQWAKNHAYGFDYADSGQGKAPSHPAQMMTWYDAVKWYNARSQSENLTPCYYTDAGLTTIYKVGKLAPFVNWSANGYRLPTEAEWEKAARGGVSGQRFPWGNTIDESQANYFSDPFHSYDVNSYSGYNTNINTGTLPVTSPVGFFAPNGYGLYDMPGNVCQWCWDWYGDYPSGAQTDPCGPATGSNRLCRGGAYISSAFVCRTAYRGPGNPAIRDYTVGFRCARGAGQ